MKRPLLYCSGTETYLSLHNYPLRLRLAAPSLQVNPRVLQVDIAPNVGLPSSKHAAKASGGGRQISRLGASESLRAHGLTDSFGIFQTVHTKHVLSRDQYLDLHLQ